MYKPEKQESHRGHRKRTQLNKKEFQIVINDDFKKNQSIVIESPDIIFMNPNLADSKLMRLKTLLTRQDPSNEMPPFRQDRKLKLALTQSRQSSDT